MMSLDRFAERSEHPLDPLERLASRNAWAFDRTGDDEMSVSVAGRWSNYQASFTWIEELEALHLACAFDLKVPERRRTEVLRLLSIVNEQLWVGHFGLWRTENAVLYRQALILAGGAEPTSGQCATMMTTALGACDRYYQAFQFVLWAGKSAQESLDMALFETEGEA